MIAPLSFLAAFDKMQAKPASGEVEASESAVNQGNDGFAALIAQLVQIVPAPAPQGANEATLVDGQTGKVPTGKILPDDGRNLAATTAEQALGKALETGSAVTASGAATTSSATIIAFQQTQTVLAGKQTEPTTRAEVQAEPSSAVSKEATGAQINPRADQIRMSVAFAPAETAVIRVSAPQDGSTSVEKQLAQASATQGKDGTGAHLTSRTDQVRLPVTAAPAENVAIRTSAPQDASAAIEKQLVQGSAPQSGDTRQSGRDPQAPAPGTAERGQSARFALTNKETGPVERPTQAAAVETASGTARTSGAAEINKPFAAAVETVVAPRLEGGRPSTTMSVSTMTSVEGIERLVERLSVAREFDMAKSASIAVTHREFGALTVTFDNARNGLDVEIAAKDVDMQRALALAVSADRANSRSPESLQQSFQQAPQGTPGGSERGAGSTGQGATSSGAHSPEGGTQGDRSPQQRDRTLASAPEDLRNSARPSPGDDALYA